MLTLRDVRVKYGDVTALDMTGSITIEAGDHIGIIGSNGAGKTTLVKAVLGLVGYTGVIDTDLAPGDMAVHMQKNEYTSSMPVQVVLEMVLNTSVKENEKLRRLIEFFEFGPCLKKRYSKLSGGQQQRFTLILVMMQDAPLVFLDEVTSGLDFETREKLVEKMEEWYQGSDKTLLVVSHYYEELEQLAKKLLILSQGKVVAYGNTRELFRRYCGESVLILKDTPEMSAAVRGRRAIRFADTVAVCCADAEEEILLASSLIRKNINFKRSDCDIELLYQSAIAAFEGRELFEEIPKEAI